MSNIIKFPERKTFSSDKSEPLYMVLILAEYFSSMWGLQHQRINHLTLALEQGDINETEFKALSDFFSMGGVLTL